ncbi:N-acetylglutaminylglutamine amidotransferase [Desulfofustis glycolicus]|uniref:asparagine synthase (glutamine-hydrolyzing) n=1 Tax=Desulfofustis glycolicus DSM 9705 TaxID=1121409 RepID=A0A1M5Y1I6_9BACT|nr:N-acetylglutaminylglutamine amidotransferase [Desulfofustis glycolicus]MCB2217719.1 N-acetylglutaminylglutamine amidotransferase [Desulfobulbaceae bacterium]SHI05809.1 asparagine synthase (glutamine-hydrolysing) [Desulfofustis glycolicus DSM 9705]
MCGIAGEFRFDHQQASLSAIDKMMAAMVPRGPDAAGTILTNETVFGHRRLKIIDLSEQSRQPLSDPFLGLDIVFNGCIYNYRELRTELEQAGYRFFSEGDTEVILKAYHAWGTDCLQRFNGMFAFAIHERESGRLVLARDRLGIKPLYLSATRQRLRFASSLPALLTDPAIDRSINPQALHHYLHWHAVVPAPHTILNGISKLPPATLRIYEPDGRFSEQTYWQLTIEPDERADALSTTQWADLLLETLRRAVKRRMVADVPVGVLLSGGVDSSLLVGLLADEGQNGLNTFSVGFESAGGEKGDEFFYSDIIAERFATDHHKIFVKSERLLDNLPGCIKAMSEPMVSYDNIGFYLLSQEVAKHVKVVQSGQGADEVFGGYHWYRELLDSTSPVDDYCRSFFDRDHNEFSRMVRSDLVHDDFSRAYVDDFFARPGATHPVAKALRLDTTVMLVDDPVKRVDNMTMAASLEARVPFLDHELVELAGRMPTDIKVGQSGKWILKEAARQVVPDSVIDRPKGYFPVPALKHIEGVYLDLVRRYLTNDMARQRGLYQQDYIDSLLAEPQSHLTPLRGSKLWQAALLEMWLQTHEI